jgi:hypothetical protein
MNPTPLPELLRAVAKELRSRARNVRKTDDFHALVLSTECDAYASRLEEEN